MAWQEGQLFTGGFRLMWRWVTIPADGKTWQRETEVREYGLVRVGTGEDLGRFDREADVRRKVVELGGGGHGSDVHPSR